MSIKLNRAASVTPPVQGTNVYVVAGTAASQRVAIPTAWFGVQASGLASGQWVTIEADGDDFYIAFGDSTMVVDETAVTTFPATFDGDECVKVADGSGKQFDLDQIGGPGGVTHFAWKGSGSTGYLRITRSSGKV